MYILKLLKASSLSLVPFQYIGHIFQLEPERDQYGLGP